MITLSLFYTVVLLLSLILQPIFTHSLRDTQSSQTTYYSLDNSSNSFSIIGRSIWDNSKKGVVFDWSATQINFNVIGTCLSIYITLEAKNSFFNIYLNGTLLSYPLKVNNGRMDYIIGSQINDTQIKLLKRTEAFITEEVVYFYGVKLVGNCTLSSSSPTPKSKLIEFVGDSDSCAYGVEGSRGSQYSYSTQNVDKGFTGLVSKALNADYYSICVSGVGAVYSADKYLSNMREYYSRSSFWVNSSVNNITSTQPDLISIFLGGNDWYTLKTSGYANQILETFKQNYTSFLQLVRKFNPPKNGLLPIILVNSPGLSTASAVESKSEMDEVSNRLKPLLQSAVEAAGGDNQRIYFKLATSNPLIDFKNDQDWGSDGHWSTQGQSKFARGVLSNIEEVTGWKRVSDIIISSSSTQTVTSNSYYSNTVLFLLILILLILSV